MRKKQPTAKICPLINAKCLKSGCEMYDEVLDRCIGGLLAYNMYKLQAVIKKQLEE